MNSIRSRLSRRRALLLPLLGILALVVAFTGRDLVRRPAAATSMPVESVQRRSIAVTIEASGTVEPIHLVEIKSKASGQIVAMPVEVGSRIHAGDLLAQIDKRDVQNQYDQTAAALRAAQARVDVTRAQKQRADTLFVQQITTVDEHETAALAYASAQSDFVRARTDLDLARQRLEDATVRAPIEGTVLSQLVSNGQVISSATSSASGGTTLLEMADLSRIRLRALVSETDIGSVHPGQSSTVTVDAFPQQSFTGTVEKIEPQAVIQQSVTMFPVLISISNESHLLLPGMNGEISMLVAQRDNVVAIPIDAVRSVRELPAMATAVGMDAASVQAQLQQQADTRRARVAATQDPQAAGQSATGRGSAAADSSRRGRWRGRAGGGGSAGGVGAIAGATRPDSRGGGAIATPGGGMGAARASNRAQAVLVKTEHGFEPRLVHLGLSNFDYAQVLDGVQEGDQVALLSVAEVQASRQQDQNRLRQRLGTGMPGTTTAGGGRGTGGGGAGRGGGGQ